MPLDSFLLKEFAARCQIVFDLCTLHKKLFDQNTEQGFMKQGPFYSIFGRINHATQEHFILQVAKLHDPAFQTIQKQQKGNLGIAYILETGEWSPEIQKQLEACCNEMDRLYTRIKNARNWTLCHNDVDAIKKGETLGAFEKDADEAYFHALEQFLNIAYNSLLNQNFVFDRSLQEDIPRFIRHFNRQ